MIVKQVKESNSVNKKLNMLLKRKKNNKMKKIQIQIVNYHVYKKFVKAKILI